MNDSIASVVVIAPNKEFKLDKKYLDNIGVGMSFVIIILLVLAYKTGKM